MIMALDAESPPMNVNSARLGQRDAIERTYKSG